MDLNNLNIAKNGPHIEIPPSLKASRHSLGEVFLLLIVIGLFYWFIVQPKRTVLEAKETQQAQLQEKKKALEESMGNLDRLISELKSHPQEAAKLEEAMPLEGKNFRLDMLIHALAQQVGVTVADVNVNGKPDAVIAGNATLLADKFGAVRKLQKLSGNAYVVGTYNQLEAFLRKVEKNSRVMDIRTMDIAGAEGDNLGLKLELEAYYYE